MRLTFLGTAAAEAYPALFCDCPNCEAARQLGGRNLRLRSSLLVNEDLLLDAGPDLAASATLHGAHLSRLRVLLITHAHEDHCYTCNLGWRASENRATPLPALRAFGPARAIRLVAASVHDGADTCLTLTAVEPYAHWQTETYDCCSYPASHGDHAGEAQIYAVGDGQHRILYACDTGPWGEAVWEAMRGERFDAVVLDKTFDEGGDGEGHHDTASFLATHARFQAEGLLAPGAAFVASHVSHDNPPHERLEAMLRPHGVVTAYDGLQLSL